MLRNTVEEGGYDAIFICSEAILELILPLIGVCPAWRALPLSAPDSVKVTLSKSASLRLAEKAGVVVPRTLVPTDQNQVEALGRELGFPLVVKGDKGEATQNVRFVWQPSELLARYMQVSAADSVYHGRPALQEFIPGPQYSLGGLFHDGEPLRICAYRKLFTYPIPGGLTAKAITERPRELLDSACAIFRALRYTGFGQVQFIRDSRDGRFKFLEINPRVWACIGLAQHAGVDLYTPYADLAAGRPVRPDLAYKEGVQYHRFTVELRLVLRRPSHLFQFVKDSLNPRVHSDFEWGDPGPHLPSIHQLKCLRMARMN